MPLDICVSCLASYQLNKGITHFWDGRHPRGFDSLTPTNRTIISMLSSVENLQPTAGSELLGWANIISFPKVFFFSRDAEKPAHRSDMVSISELQRILDFSDELVIVIMVIYLLAVQWNYTTHSNFTLRKRWQMINDEKSYTTEQSLEHCSFHVLHTFVM